MPATIEIKEASGKTGRVKLPVEIWQHGSTWRFYYHSTGKISRVTIDPDKLLPDINELNNSYPVIQPYSVKAEDLDKYTGVYSNAEIQLKITVTKEGNQLKAQATGQNSFNLVPVEQDIFKFDAAGIEMDFSPDKGEFTLKQGGGTYIFIKDK